VDNYRIRFESVIFAAYDFGDAEGGPAKQSIVRKDMLSMFRGWINQRKAALERHRPLANEGVVESEDIVARLEREVALLEMLVRNMRIVVYDV
jgi:hypothetical protein